MWLCWRKCFTNRQTLRSKIFMPCLLSHILLLLPEDQVVEPLALPALCLPSCCHASCHYDNGPNLWSCKPAPTIIFLSVVVFMISFHSNKTLSQFVFVVRLLWRFFLKISTQGVKVRELLPSWGQVSLQSKF